MEAPTTCPMCGEGTFEGRCKTTKGVAIHYVVCLNVACDWADKEEGEPTEEAE